MCSELHVERLDPARARLRCLAGLASGEALTLPYYRSREMAAWIKRVVHDQRIDTAIVFSG
jgi:hypothetical protein